MSSLTLRILPNIILFMVMFSAAVGVALRQGEGMAQGWQVPYASKATDGVWSLLLYDVDRRLTLELQVDAVMRNPPLLSPDQRFVVWSDLQDLVLYDRETHTQSSIPGGMLAQSWSPDSRHLIYTDGNINPMIVTIDDSGDVVEQNLIPLDESEDFSFMSWSPDSTQLALMVLSMMRSDMVIIDWRSGERLNITENAPGYYLAPAWSVDGESLAYVSETSLYLYPPNDGSINGFVIDGLPDAVSGLYWSPDGTQLAVVESPAQSRLYIVDMQTETLRGPLDLGLGVRGVRWSPDGERLIFISARDSDLYTMTAEGRFPRRLTDTRNLNVLMP